MRSKYLTRFIFMVFFFYAISGYAQVAKKEQTKPASGESNGYHRFKAWLTTGNSGTNPSKNFIGTTDAQPLIFRVNNQRAGYLDHSEYNLNTAFGYHTLNANIVSDSGGRFTSAFGAGALSSNTTGWGNTAHGAGALSSNTTGSINTAVGGEVLISNTTGGFNTAIGYNSLYANQTGSFNTATGDYTLFSNTTGIANIANGASFTLTGNTEGSFNIGTGVLALTSNTTGNANIAYGSFSLASNVTGNNNTAIGDHADVTADNLNNATAIGNGALVDASNKVRIGNDDISSIGGKVGWTNYSDERIKDGISENVPGLSFINALRPVTYHIITAKENALLGKKEMRMDAISTSVKVRPELAGLKDMEAKAFQRLAVKERQPNPAKVTNESEKIQYTGFLAQEVDKAAKSIGYDFSGVDKTGKIMGLRYGEFVVPLVKAVQELSKKNEELERKDDLLEEKLNKLEALINGKLLPVSTATTTFLLEQNKPNPLKRSTSIRYGIPYDFQKAQLMLSDFNGRVIKKIELNAASGVVYIDGSLLSNGGYTYALIIDNRIAATKKLIVAK